MIFIKVSSALWKLRYSTSFFLNAFTNSTERFRKKNCSENNNNNKKKEIQKDVFENLAKFKGIHRYRSFFVIETPAEVFSCEFYKSF